MGLFKKKHENEDLCPHCIEVIHIHHPEYSYQFLCPNCHKPIYWDSNLRILKIGTNQIKRNDSNKEKELRKLTKTEILFIKLCIILFILDTFTSVLLNNIKSKQYEKIENELTSIEHNVLSYIEDSEYEKAELEANKLNIFVNLPEDKQAIWKANQESLIRIIEEKSGKTIKEEPIKEKKKNFFGISF